MAYNSKVGSFNLDTTKTAGQTQAITGVGFQPKIVLFWWGGSTGTGDGTAGGTIRFGFGAASSSTSRFCVSGISQDAEATSLTSSGQRNDEAIRVWSAGGSSPTLEGVMDFSSMDADGFTLVVDDQFANAYRISYLALGGTDLTNVFLGNKQTPASTGNYSVTGVGFQPDAVIIATRPAIGLNQHGAQAPFSLGFATGSGNQGAAAGMSQNNQASSVAAGSGYNGEIYTYVWNATLGTYWRGAFVSMDSDGFTINHLETTTQYYYFFIALKGGQYSVGDITTRTDGNDIAETVGAGFTPLALLFASANRALSTQNEATAHHRISIGAATSATERACAAWSDEDALADTETAYANYDTAVYANIVDDAIAGLMDIKSIDANTGFTAVMDDADPSACWVTYLAIGSSAGAPVNISLATAGMTANGQTITVVEGEVNIPLATATDTLSGIQATIITGAMIALNTAAMTSAGITLIVVPGEKTTLLNVAAMTASGRAIVVSLAELWYVDNAATGANNGTSWADTLKPPFSNPEASRIIKSGLVVAVVLKPALPSGP